MILSDWLQSTPAIMERAGIQASKSELYLWLSLVTGKSRAYFVSRTSESMEDFLSKDNIRHLEDILLRRLEREPLAYIIGFTSFWGNTLQVGPGVLVPRPDSEMVIELALALAGYRQMPWGQCCNEDHEALTIRRTTQDPLRFMDLCTGSGCLGISFALEAIKNKDKVSGILTENSQDAIYYAKKNIDTCGMREELKLVKCDLLPDFNFVSDLWDNKKADFILANPPYITAADMETLMPEVIDYEPEMALRGGEDGLDFYRRILHLSRPYMASGAWLVLEHGYDQGDSVPALCIKNGYANVICFRDYGGQTRVTIAQNMADTVHTEE